MNESAILTKIISDLDARFPSGVDIRTEGGDQTIDPPEVIIEWGTSDLGENESNRNEFTKIYANSGYGEGGFGDGGAGEGTLAGVKRHEYRHMRLVLTHRYEDELSALDGSDVSEGYFKQFDGEPENFDTDTTNWDVGDITPTDFAFEEPDWYAVDLVVEFDYVKYYDDTSDFDILEDITLDIETTG